MWEYTHSDHHISIRLYKNVKNMPELRKKVIEGTLKCSLVKPALICDPFQIAVAFNKALIAEGNKEMKTRTVFSETLFNLSVSKNITESLLKFGVDNKDTELLVAVVLVGSDNGSEVWGQIEGELCQAEELSSFHSLNIVRKCYKIPDGEFKVSSLLDSIVSRISTKDFLFNK